MENSRKPMRNGRALNATTFWHALSTCPDEEGAGDEKLTVMPSQHLRELLEGGTSMGVPKLGTVAVRITAEGHASRRWKSARSADEAARLNQLLSDARARTIYAEVEKIVKTVLPSFPIAL